MNRILAFFLLSFFVCLGASAQTQAPIGVICGGKAYTDSKGNLWQADFGYNEGIISANAKVIAGTTDPTLFPYGRWNGVVLSLLNSAGHTLCQVNLALDPSSANFTSVMVQR